MDRRVVLAGLAASAAGPALAKPSEPSPTMATTQPGAERPDLPRARGQMKLAEFVASNESELRWRLNSILILASYLVENQDGNLTAKQVEMLHAIDDCGRDLFHLIGDILDLSKGRVPYGAGQRGRARTQTLPAA